MALRLRAQTSIRAPAQAVFQVICAPERLPEWNTSVERAMRLPAEAPVGLGSRAVMTGRLLGQRLESETQVVAYEPPRLFATEATRGPRLRTRFELLSQPHGTDVGIEVTGSVPGGRLAEGMAEGFLRSQLRASLDRLRELCEREAHQAAAAEPLQGSDPACWLHLQPNDGN